MASAEGWRAGTKSLPGEEMPSLEDLEAGPFLHWPPVAPSAACSRGGSGEPSLEMHIPKPIESLPLAHVYLSQEKG